MFGFGKKKTTEEKHLYTEANQMYNAEGKELKKHNITTKLRFNNKESPLKSNIQYNQNKKTFKIEVGTKGTSHAQKEALMYHELGHVTAIANKGGLKTNPIAREKTAWKEANSSINQMPSSERKVAKATERASLHSYQHPNQVTYYAFNQKAKYKRKTKNKSPIDNVLKRIKNAV